MQGLALPSLSKQGQMPAFFRMLEGNMLDEPLFSIWLSPDPTTEPAGKIMFGGHNPQRYVGDLVDLPVISKKWVNPTNNYLWQEGSSSQHAMRSMCAV